jgi:hypothetical protein
MTYSLSSAILNGASLFRAQMENISDEEPQVSSFSFPYTDETGRYAAEIMMNSLANEQEPTQPKERKKFYVDVILKTEDRGSSASDWIITGSKQDLLKFLENKEGFYEAVVHSLQESAVRLNKDI